MTSERKRKGRLNPFSFIQEYLVLHGFNSYTYCLILWNIFLLIVIFLFLILCSFSSYAIKNHLGKYFCFLVLIAFTLAWFFFLTQYFLAKMLPKSPGFCTWLCPLGLQRSLLHHSLLFQQKAVFQFCGCSAGLRSREWRRSTFGHHSAFQMCAVRESHCMTGAELMSSSSSCKPRHGRSRINWLAFCHQLLVAEYRAVPFWFTHFLGSRPFVLLQVSSMAVVSSLKQLC